MDVDTLEMGHYDRRHCRRHCRHLDRSLHLAPQVSQEKGQNVRVRKGPSKYHGCQHPRPACWSWSRKSRWPARNVYGQRCQYIWREAKEREKEVECVPKDIRSSWDVVFFVFGHPTWLTGSIHASRNPLFSPRQSLNHTPALRAFFGYGRKGITPSIPDVLSLAVFVLLI